MYALFKGSFIEMALDNIVTLAARTVSATSECIIGFKVQKAHEMLQHFQLPISAMDENTS